VLFSACSYQDVDEGRCIRYPKLYVLGQQNVLFNSFIFARSLMKGIFHAIVIFFVTFGCYYLNFYPSEGYEVDYQSFGYVASGALTFVVTLQVCCLIMCVLLLYRLLQIAMDTLLWTPITHIAIWGSIVLWFVCTLAAGTSPFYLSPLGYSLLSYLGVPFEVLGTGNFYFCCMLVIAVSLFPVIMFRSIQNELNPTTVDDVRLKLAKEGIKVLKDIFSLPGRLHFHPRIPARLKRDKSKPVRSGYAFAHEGGFGGIITSGLGLRKKQRIQGDIHRRNSALLSSTSRPSSNRASPHSSTEKVDASDEGTVV